MEGKLKIDAIKTVFAGLEHEDQVSLILDLMGFAKIDSITRNDRPVHINMVEINSPKGETSEGRDKRLYRNEFDAWLYDTCLRDLIVVEKSYLDECFALYTMIFETTYCGMMKEGQKLTVWSNDQRLDLSKDKSQIKAVFRYGMFEKEADDVEMITYAFGRQLHISLNSLFFNLDNHGKDVRIIMYIFGYDQSQESHELFERFVAGLSDEQALELLMRKFEGIHKA